MKERPSPLRFILYLLSGLFMAPGMLCWGQVPPNVQTDIFLPAPRELTQHLSRARKAIDEEEYGEAVLHLDEEEFDLTPGMVAFIPGGVGHSLDNKSETEDFVLLTFWEDAKFNGVHHARIKAWGTSFKTIDED